MNFRQKFIIVTIPLIVLFGSINLILYFQPSLINSVFGLEIPEGLTFPEVMDFKNAQDECFRWGDSWGKNKDEAGIGSCNFDDRIIKPIAFTEKCGDLYQKYVYTCISTAEGCAEGYILHKDHWNSFMCIKKEYFESASCTDGWKIVWTSTGFGCSLIG